MRQARRSLGVRAAIITGLLTAVAATRAHDVAAQLPELRWDGLIEHLTAGASDPQPDGPSRLSRHSVTRDGRYVVFDSDATNLGSWGEPSAIYRRDRMTGSTERLFGMTGSDAVISGDGQHIAFVHCGGWFRPDMSPICDVYVVDLRNWSFIIASSGLDGTYSDGPSSQPVLSGDGRFVLFRTTAPNLIPAGASAHQIMLRDRDADEDGIFDESEPGAVTLETVSASSFGVAANGPSESAEVSDDGKVVAFRSLASNLVDGDSNAHWDVFLRDRVTGETRRINVGWDGQQATPTIDSPEISMSADGRYVAFASDDWYMVPQWTHLDDTNNNLDVFVYDREQDSRTRIDLGVDGSPGNGATLSPMLTEDGRHVLLVTSSTNVGSPSANGLPQVYVHDRFTLITQRVSYKPDWSEANAAWERPVISRDGSLIVFSSRATDLAEQVTNGIDAIYAASHFDVSPPQLTISGHGGRVTTYVTAQAYTPWQVTLKGNGWLDYDSLPFGNGPGSVSFLASGANPDGTPRTATAEINSKIVVITQGPGLTVSAISPIGGPATGGNEVTITGTGFLNGTVAYFDGVLATRTEFVSTTTLRADPPAHAPGVVALHVMSPDGRFAMLPEAYRYLDNTPPQITPYVEGTLGNNGWYKSDVSISWLVRDDDSPGTVSWGAGCAQSWLRTDTEGTTYTCTAGSEGGSASASVTVKRDARPPFVAMSTPQETLYRANQAVTASYSCHDPTPGSRIASCVGSVPNGSPLPTSTPGRYEFTVAATDQAGWTFGASRRYGVGYATCQPWPEGLVAWWPGDNDYRDAAGGHTGTMINPVVQGTAFFQGIQNQAISTNSNAQRYLQIGDSPDFEFSGSFTLASWFYVLSTLNAVNVIAGREGEYMLAYGSDLRLRYALQTADHEWGWVNTGIAVPVNVYTHVAMIYDGAAVKIYVNGALAFTRTATGPVGDALPDMDDFRIGARQLPSEPSYFTGHFDNVMVLGRPMPANEVEGLFLSGFAGLCPKPTTIRIVPNPSVKTYGSSWVEVVAELTGPDGPIAGRSIGFYYSTQSIGGGQTTDANGIARHWINVPSTQNPGTYPGIIHVRHAVTSDLQAFEAHGDLLVVKATPVISWNTPAAIAHGTALSSTQLNAIANTGGAYTYTPGWGTVLPAGDHTLSLLFQPSDSTRYTTATATVTINVRRAVPTISVSGGTFVYDGAPHPATGTVTGLGGIVLGPLTFAYNGAPDVPVAAGTYSVLAEFAGNANYEPGSRSATVTITKAAPSMSLTGGTFTYDGSPHAAQVSLTGVGGTGLEPVTLTYNGSPDAPVLPGEYTVIAEFAGNANYQAATRTATLTIGRATPSVTVTGGSVVFDGQPHAATAVATGIGGETLGPLALTYNGSSELPVNAGNYTVSAEYSGNGHYTTATGTGTLVIAKAPAVVTVADASVTYDGLPHGATGTATGVGGAALGPLTFTYNGVTDVPVAAGTYTVVASFAGDANHEPASGAATLTIGKASATVSAVGGSFTYDAQPHSASGTATGVGGAALGPLTFTYNGAPDVPVAAGTYAVVASFAGDANHEPASSTATLAIGKAAVTLQWTRPAAITYGTPLGGGQLSATANVPGTFVYTPAQGAVLGAGAGRGLAAVFTPADPANYTGGTVQTTLDVLPAPLTIRGNDVVKMFGAPVPLLTASANGFVNGESWAALSGSLALATTAAAQSPVGTYPVVPSGLNSPNYAITFASGALTIVHGSVVVALTSSPQPSGFDQPMVFSATVVPAAPAAGSPAGTVRFFDGPVLLGTVTLTGTGTASLTTAGLDAGTRTIEARYDGDAAFAPGTATASHEVRTASQTPSISITSSRNPSSVGQTVTLTANVSMGTGSMQFYDGATLLGTATISAGRATLTTTALAAGSHPVTARYLGSATMPPARSAVFVQAVGASGWKNRTTTIVVSTSPSSSTPGSPVTISATVSGSSGAPTGTILFMVNGEVVGSVGVTTVSGTSSTATLALPGLAGGRHKVSATYLGSSNYKGSTTQLTHVVN